MASTTIFMPQNGYLLAVRAQNPTPALLSIAGLNANAQDILITSFTQQANVAHQVTQTVGGPEYIFAFGDMLQDLAVGVVVYAKNCSQPEGNSESYLKAWQFYNGNRLQPGKVQVINLTFAGIKLRGLIVGFTTQADSVNGAAVIRGTITLKGWTVTETGGNGGDSSQGSSSSPSQGRPRTAVSIPASEINRLADLERSRIAATGVRATAGGRS